MELLNVCMKESMLTDPALLQTATKIIKLCETFAHFILVSNFLLFYFKCESNSYNTCIYSSLNRKCIDMLKKPKWD